MTLSFTAAIAARYDTFATPGTAANSLSPRFIVEPPLSFAQQHRRLCDWVELDRHQEPMLLTARCQSFAGDIVDNELDLNMCVGWSDATLPPGFVPHANGNGLVEGKCSDCRLSHGNEIDQFGDIHCQCERGNPDERTPMRLNGVMYVEDGVMKCHNGLHGKVRVIESVRGAALLRQLRNDRQTPPKPGAK
ncbi:hypothetical protein BDV25DRAFT_142009 [Aspergillus avenaceus]|uniref:Cyanovirin-N domain-containing protein n=1 Tax=Aspergillus avenaceus TaxID=36643 RepID=A0A5N6TPI8_ASPAV|nr:hypothetical protein BDV25DRAFT_142009 [Aspergillus avenaceus]